VAASDGRSVSGFIRWDNDEEHAWEVLEGLMDGVELSIELGRIRRIEPGQDGVTVALHDGRTFVLEGSEDLGDLGASNRGVFVTPEQGETVLVKWQELSQATFDP
jgi:hypothetical protein